MTSLIVSLAAVAAGGFLGGVTRWALSHLNADTFHPGTWASNVIGSAVLGFSCAMPGLWALAAGAGFAGAASTWPMLAKELGEHLKARRWGDAARSVALTAAVSVVAAYWGVVYGQRVFG
ncbi:CrcB protein [Corynebacterium timonense]|uniref:Fluoride-specific ion channel n=2 Tax=Corynebacterium timonense TaxID=441500 RepID=A0A1H1LD02_9CORY|nr:CrcB family protein [Corynebacterium timonense]SDR72471.1 CrcB protein [Corynebacterium timonense]